MTAEMTDNQKLDFKTDFNPPAESTDTQNNEHPAQQHSDHDPIQNGGKFVSFLSTCHNSKVFVILCKTTLCNYHEDESFWRCSWNYYISLCYIV